MQTQLLANALYTIHQGKSGGRGLSPRLWAMPKGQALSPDGLSNAVFIGDDFLNFSGFSPASAGTTALPSTTVPGPSGYGLYLDTATAAASVTNVPGEGGGIARIGTPGNDNHEAWLASGGNTGSLGLITAARLKLTVFEARIRVNSVADNVASIFVGLSAPGNADADTKADNTGVLKDSNFLGFNTVHAAGGVLDVAYRASGQAQQSAGSAALAADTWTKVGIVIDPTTASEAARFYIDNIQVGALTLAQVSAATFPEDTPLAFLAGVKNGSAAASNLDIDWWAFYQAH